MRFFIRKRVVWERFRINLFGFIKNDTQYKIRNFYDCYEHGKDMSKELKVRRRL